MVQFNVNDIQNDKYKIIIDSLHDVAANSELGELFKFYLVGGFTRDYLMGKSSYDIDVMVVHPEADDPNVNRQKVMEDLKNVANHIADALRIHRNDNISNQGTITLTDKDGEHIDIALARKETYSGESRKPEVQPATFEEDALRRDFTINTMAVDLSNYEIQDPTGKGMSDLKNKVLRMPLTPYETFLDDPLRVLRAIRMKNRLGFELHPDIERVFQNKEQMKELLTYFGRGKKVSFERLNEEIWKMMQSPNFGSAISDLQKLGIMSTVDAVFDKQIGDKVVGILNNTSQDFDEVDKLVMVFSDLESLKQYNVDAVKNKTNDILKKLKYDNQTIKDTLNVLQNLAQISEQDKGLDFDDIKLKTYARQLGKYYDRVIKLMPYLYEQYDKFLERVEQMGGIGKIQEPLGISGDWFTQQPHNLKGPAVGTAIKDAVKITKIYNMLTEDMFKAKMDGQDWKFDVNTGKVLDENGKPVVANSLISFKKISKSLSRLADSMEKIGLFHEAVDVDILIKHAAEDLWGEIIQASKNPNAIPEDKAADLGRRIDEFVKSGGLRKVILEWIPKFKEVFFEGEKPIPHQSPYHQEDIWEHTVRVAENMNLSAFPKLKDKLTMLFAALFHDVGKPAAKKWIDRADTGIMDLDQREGMYRYIGHAGVGSHMVGDMLQGLGVSSEISDNVIRLVRNHIDFADTMDKFIKKEPVSSKLSERLRREHEDLPLAFHMMNQLSIADRKGTTPDIETLKRLKRETEKRNVEDPEENLRGEQLLEHLLNKEYQAKKTPQVQRQKLQTKTETLSPDEVLVVERNIFDFLSENNVDPKFAKQIVDAVNAQGDFNKDTLMRYINTSNFDEMGLDSNVISSLKRQLIGRIAKLFQTFGGRP